MKKKQLISILATSLLYLTFFAMMALSVRGVPQNPTSSNLNSDYYKVEGPFELSPERGRFALTYSLIEDRSLFFSLPIARFVTPDLGYINGHYVSLFAPTVSLLVIPGYVLGSWFGLSQVGTFVVVSMFSIVNSFLIRTIALKFGAKKAAATLAGTVFLFASPAYAYAVNLYQHHFSTFVILLTILVVVSKKMDWKKVTLILFFSVFSVTIDYPNLFMMFPLVLFTLSRIILTKNMRSKFILYFDKKYLISVVGFVLPLILFGLYNYYSFGNPLTLSGAVQSVDEIDEHGLPYQVLSSDEDRIDVTKIDESRSFLGFFEPRDLIRGLNIHLFSTDRGILFFTPVMFMGVLGAYVMYRTDKTKTLLLLAVALFNLTLYSMWGDPWGGWAFGSRYLIPTYAVLSIFISLALSKYSHKKLLILLFYVLLGYSVAVNTLGAITTSANPPKIQAIPLQEVTGRIERYSFDRNWEYLNNNGSKSFFYNEYADSYVSARTYYFILVFIVLMLSLSLVWRLTKEREN